MKKKFLLGALLAALAILAVVLTTQGSTVQGKLSFCKFKGNCLQVKDPVIDSKLKPITQITKDKTIAVPLTFDQLIAMDIPSEWLNQFEQDFTINFLESGFNRSDKDILRNMVYRAVFVGSQIDSYFSEPLPWTEGENLYDWMADSIDEIRFFSDPDRLQTGNTRRINLNGRSYLDVASQNYADPFDQISNSSGFFTLVPIIHETRHNNGIFHSSCDGSGYYHDKTLKYMGGHGVNVLFGHWVEHKLPSWWVQDFTDKYGDRYFVNMDSILTKMCTFNNETQLLDQEDVDWLIEISGHPPRNQG